MTLTPQAITKFDENIMDTMSYCIMKISENLKKRYDPDSPESNSLFRLFCSASRTMMQMTNKYLRAKKIEIQNTQNQNTKNIVNSNQSNFNNIPVDNSNSSLKQQKNDNNHVASFWKKKKTA